MGEPQSAPPDAFLARARVLIREEAYMRNAGLFFRVDRTTGSIALRWMRCDDGCEYWAKPSRGLTMAWFRRKWEKGESRYDKIDVRPGAM